ncbi:hypothetical protein [Arcanobacterium phocae]|uniref:hypothetical protein n=1 Tax=Arcanobacterium phocae TaxID=131112 RepID=UPI001C0F36A4|nr:hypothetical protein [Arcanobacterium phocae]
MSIIRQPAPNALSFQEVLIQNKGCSETCPIYPGKHYEDWDVSDPANQSLDQVRIIRDDITGRVADLINRIMLAQ